MKELKWWYVVTPDSDYETTYISRYEVVTPTPHKHLAQRYSASEADMLMYAEGLSGVTGIWYMIQEATWH